MKTLTDVILQAASKTPDRQIVFARRDGRDVTCRYADLLLQARRTLATLQQQELKPGQRVVIQCQSAQRQITLFWACVLGGMVPVLLPKVASWLRDSDLARKLDGVLHILPDALLIIDADQESAYLEGSARPARQGCRWQVDRPSTGNAEAALIHDAVENDLAYLQFSSGSTAMPKGVRLTHRNLISNIRDIADTVRARPEESTLSWMPYYHDMGLISFHLVPMYRGMGQIKLEAHDFIAEPLFWLQQIMKHHAEVISSPNFGLQHVLDRVTPPALNGLDLSCVRLLCNGAEPISALVMKKFCDLLATTGFRRRAMFPVYGLAEACVAVSFSPPETEPLVHRVHRDQLFAEGKVVAASDAHHALDDVEYVDVGFPLPSVQVRIACVSDESDESDRLLSEDAVGEVQIRGANVTSGYEGSATINEGLFTPDGWLKTGDLGFLHQERLVITGRLKEVIFVHGRNVMATDVERFLSEQLGLKEGSIAVCATSDHSRHGNDRIVVFVAARRKKDFWSWAHELRQVAETYLAYPVEAVLPLPRFPRTSSGKLQRFQLIEAWLQGAYEDACAEFEANDPRRLMQVTQTMRAEISSAHAACEKTVRAIWAEVLHCPESSIGTEASFIKLGGSSVKAIEMLARIEEHYGKTLGYALLIECSTLGEVVSYLEQHLATVQAMDAVSDSAVSPPSESISLPSDVASRKIAIIGWACRFPGGRTPEEFWETLIEGRNKVLPVPPSRWSRQDQTGADVPSFMGVLSDIDRFAADFFGISPEEALIMDPQQRLMLEVAYEAMDDAGYGGERLNARRSVGVFIGASSNSYMERVHRVRNHVHEHAAQEINHPLLMPANLLNMIAARVSHTLNLKGAALTIDTACSSSLVALQQACNDLLLGNCEMALAGGVNVLPTSSAHELLAQAGALSPDGLCRAFDAAANGMVPGEGLGLLVLKPLDRALAEGDRIEAIIDAVAVNNDGRSIGIMAPTPEGQEAVIRQAVQRADIDPSQIGYVEAHGTGTPIGDPIEVRALTAAFGGRNVNLHSSGVSGSCGIGSVKTNVGHLLAAAGVAGLIKIVLALRHEQIPPTLHLNTPHPRIRFEKTPFYPVMTTQPWPRGEKPRYASISSFGFGGTNAHAILHDAPAVDEDVEEAQSSYLLTLSARNPNELSVMRRELKDHLVRHPRLRMLDVCFTRAAGRANFPCREFYVVTDRTDALAQLEVRITAGHGADMAAHVKCSDHASLMTLGAEWQAGASVDWCAFYHGRNQNARIVRLPAYPMTRNSFWLSDEPPEARPGLDAATPTNPPASVVQEALRSPELKEVTRMLAMNEASRREQVMTLIEQSFHAAGMSLKLGEPNQSFALLGVDSLTALKVVNALQQHLQFPLSSSLLFEYDTVQRLMDFLCHALLQQRAGETALPLLPQASDVLPESLVASRRQDELSYAQQRLWFLEQKVSGAGAEEAAAIFNMPAAVRLTGRLDVSALTSAFSELMRRHETLRTTFHQKPGLPYPAALVAQTQVLPLLQQDLSHLDEPVRTKKLHEYLQQDARLPFDLARGPLIRIGLLRISEQEQVLFLNMHHLIADGWSMNVLLKEVAHFYWAHTQETLGGQHEKALPDLPIQYSDYVRWQRQCLAGAELTRQLDYWRKQLADAPVVLDLPWDRPRPAKQTHRGARYPFVLDAALRERLQTLAAANNATLFMVLLSAFQLLLSRYSGQTDICVGTPVACRNRMETEALIGLFVNTLVMRSRIDDEQCHGDFLAQVRDTVRQGIAHQDVPFDQVLEALNPERHLAHSPLFQVMFVMQPLPEQMRVSHELIFEVMSSDAGVAQFDLTLGVQESADVANMPAFLEYNTDVFELATVERLAAHWLHLLNEITQKPQARLHEYALIDAAERNQLLQIWNDTRTEFPSFQTFHQLFESWVAIQPEALALSFEHVDISYRELDERASQFARHLRLRCPSLAVDDVVAFCIERSIDMIVAMLGILKAGAAFLPLDPADPQDRILYMLEDAAPRLLVTRQTEYEALSLSKVHGLSIVLLDSEISVDADAGMASLSTAETGAQVTEGQAGADHLAYLIYTSGSTGQPKGVLLNHRGLCHLAQWQGQYFSLTPESRVLQFASASFDACVWELAMALGQGGSLHLATREHLLPGRPLRDFIHEQGITHATLPPVAVSLWTDHDLPLLLPTLKTLVVAGDVCSVELARYWSKRLNFYNAYGPTETTVCASVHRCLPDQITSNALAIPIGKPIANTRIYVLDAHLQIQAVGVAGEIVIGGVGVARAYLNRSELTAERFIPDPYSIEPGARLYRTGDLGRWRSDGTLEFLGRQDHQVKLRGFRIELGEIEAQIRACAETRNRLRDVLVLMQEGRSGVPADRRLAAYLTFINPITFTDEQKSLLVKKLRQHVSRTLPDYMQPSAYVILERLPLTSSGKIDRKALATLEISSDSASSASKEPPQGALESTLASIWQTVLGREPTEIIGRHDDFFALGGHSLLIVSLLERLRAVGLEARIHTIFQHPTVAGLAAALSTLPHTHESSSAPLPTIFSPPQNLIAPGCIRITPDMLPLVELGQAHLDALAAAIPGGFVNIQDIYPLAPLQEGILFHHLMNKSGDAYVLPVLLSFSNSERQAAFLDALRVMVLRHDALRTSIHQKDLPYPVQLVQRLAALQVEELSLAAGESALATLQSRMTFECCEMSLHRAPLIRLQSAVEPADGTHYLLLQLHHIISDHVSLEILLREIQHLMKAKGQAALYPQLPEPVPYRNYVAQALRYSRAANAERDVEGMRAAAFDWFHAHLGDIDEPTAPFGLMDTHGDGCQLEEDRLRLSHALAQRLRAQARRAAFSPAVLFHAAWARLVALCSGRETAVFGTVLSGRLQGMRGAEQIVGMFINTLPLRIDLQGKTTQEVLTQVHHALMTLVSHEQCPLSVALRASGLSTKAGAHAQNPLFTSLLNYRHTTLLAGWDVEEVQVLASQERTNYPLTMNIDDLGAEDGDFELVAQVDRRVGARRINVYLKTALESILDVLESQSQTPTQTAFLALNILPEEERGQLLALVQTRHEQNTLLQEVFERWAALQPAAIALTMNAMSMSYAELNRRANQWAHLLVEQGVKPDSLVALCLERSLDGVVAMLGVLKAGAAYLPMDPRWPPERIELVLKEAAPRLILTHHAWQDRFAFASAETTVICMDAVQDRMADCPADNLDAEALGLRPAHLAYVIYTSGTTGQPKGVMVEHRQLTRLFDVTAERFRFSSQDVWTLFHASSFDFSVWEIWGALLHGGRLLIVPHEVTRSPSDFYRLLCHEKVTLLNQTPSAFRQLMEAQRLLLKGDAPEQAYRHHLRCVIFGGEALDTASLQPWLANNPLEQTQLVNMYGITETTVHVTWHFLTPHDINGGTGQGSVIGVPISDLKIYLLDANQQPVPQGVLGEMYVGGDGLARGYLHQPELTERAFIPDPWAHHPQDRLYKSGDLARRRKDGTLEYLGRNDRQIKLRGFRIELGEIEAQIARDDRYAEAHVRAWRRDDVFECAESTENTQLVAYLVLRSDIIDAGLDALKLRLDAALPDYMVPAAFVVLERMPLTPHGKRDEHALPLPEPEDYRHEAYAPPQGEIETNLLAIWRHVLRLPPEVMIGRHDSFFDLGGHSLLIVTLLEQLRLAGYKVDARSIFDYPTLAALAASIREQCASGDGVADQTEEDFFPHLIPEHCTNITPEMLNLVQLEQEDIQRIVATVPGGAANVQDVYPLTPLQEGLLFHHQLQSTGDAYILPTLLRLSSRAQCDAFIDALRKVMRRHDVLRTSILWREMETAEQAVQVVHRQIELPITYFDLKSDRDVREQLEERAEQNALHIDLQHAPLLRIQMASDPQGTGSYYLILLLHHIISDHVSLEVLVREVLALLENPDADLPPSIPYRHFVARALKNQHHHQQDALDFFRERLADVDEPTAPFGLTDRDNHALSLEDARIELPTLLAAHLRSVARLRKVSVASLFHAAWAQLVSCCSGRDDVVFGTVLSGRLQGGAGQALGLFINTLPLRVRILDDTVTQVVERTHHELRALLRYELTPLAMAQRVSRVDAAYPLFTSVLNFRHGALQALPPEVGIELLASYERTHYPLTASVDDDGSGFALTLQTRPQIGATRLAGYYQHVLQALCVALEHTPDSLMREISLLSDDERHKLLNGFNAHEASKNNALYEDLTQPLNAQAQLTPDAIAVEWGKQTLSYCELHSRANQLAHHLKQQGIGIEFSPDQVVALYFERSVDMLIAILATLKAGAAWLPLDPHHPRERTQHILNEAQARIILTQHPLAHQLPSTAIPSLSLDTPETHQHLARLSNEPPATSLQSHHLAYIIYTSGSTGQPKGAMNEHRAVVNRLLWMQDSYRLTADDRILQKTPYSFDVSVWELLWPLISGARLILAQAKGHQDPAYLQRTIDDAQITTVHFVPSMLQAYLDHLEQTPNAPHHPQLKRIIVSGEELSLSLHDRCLNTLPHVELHNLYGPTEAAIDVTYHPCQLTDTSHPRTRIPTRIPIGKPIANTRIYILDPHGQPVPIGVTGELHIGGTAVGRGYVNRPELTAERFLPDPYSTEPHARMYKSGDLARWNADGEIEYLGRNDQQIKLRGLRIELGEIEAQLRQHPQIKEACVIAPEGTQLIAYYVPHALHVSHVPAAGEGENATELTASLKAHLQPRLPEYMIPAIYVPLAVMPLTPNGKLDRKALPQPQLEHRQQTGYAAPQGEIETRLAEIWQEVLQVERVGRQDDFFALGGHSLLAARVVARVRRVLQREIALRLIFEHPRLQTFATAVQRQAIPADTADIGLRSLAPQERAQHAFLPLSWGQQRLWFIDRYAQQGSRAARSAYHITGALQCRGVLDRAALQAALDAIIARHEILRTVFNVNTSAKSAKSAEPTEFAVHQCIRAAQAFQLDDTDLSGLPETQRAAELERLLEQATLTPFELAQGPLIRGVLYRLDSAGLHHVLCLVMHHIVADGWSLAILTRELASLYAAYAQGQPVKLPPLPLQYADYALWQRRQFHAAEPRWQQQLQFWQQHLAGAPPLLDLPTDFPRPAQQSYQGATLPLHLDARLTAALQALARRHELTLFIVLHAAWAVLLGRLAGQDEVVIGVPCAQRQGTELEGLIGFFVNTLALRLPVSAELSLTELLQEARTRWLAAHEHQDMPFEQIVDALQPPRSRSHAPLFQTMLALQNTPALQIELPQLSLTPCPLPRHVAHFDLTLILEETADGCLSGELEYATDLFCRATLERWLGYFQTLLQAFCEPRYAAQSLAALPLLDATQRAALIAQATAPTVDIPANAGIHALFEAQVLARPAALAVQFEQQTLTYAELNARANQLARLLRQQGVLADSIVGLCLERGIDMLVGILGIFKAGGAYLPIDPDYPPERIAWMLEDAAPVIVLTQESLKPLLTQFSAASCVWLAVDSVVTQEQLQALATANLKPAELGLSMRQLAYVIYTSGSTGKPKAVMLEHRGLVNLAVTQMATLELQADSRVLQFASVSFDACTWEIVMAWASGASLHLARREALMPGEPLLQLMQQRQISHALLPPVALAALPEGASQQLAALKVLLVGGDVCSTALVQDWARERDGVARRILNAYGPTEATVCTTLHVCHADETSVIPIGKPLANTRVYLLDAALQPVPPGVTGEIYVAGIGVARGYLQRAQLTAERFLPDPFVQPADADARMYRTGDLGRWNAQGEIEYRGRNDHQVKLRGFRIELGEIEAQLLRLPEVREACVLLRADTKTEPRLVAYLSLHTPAAQQAHLLQHLQTQLAAQLPSYMLPTAYVVLEKMPLTPNGKLDRKALPAPETSGISRGDEYVAPQGETESMLAAIWSEVLAGSVVRVGRQDDFFALGGHSLTAVQLATRIQQRFGRELTLQEIFEFPRLDAMARRLQNAAPWQADLPMQPADRRQPLPLSWSQQRLCFIEQLEGAGAGAAYVIAGALRLQGALQPAALQTALNCIVARHEVLRTQFVMEAGQLVQRIMPVQQSHFVLRAEDLSGLPAAQRNAAIERALRAAAALPFVLEQGGLIRGLLLRLGEDEHLFALTLHHIVADGWSIGILTQELASFYAAAVAGQGEPQSCLPPLPLQYADFAVWQRARLPNEAQLHYWKAQLADAPLLLELPTDHARPTRQSHAGAALPLRLEVGLSQRVREFSRQQAVTPFMTLLTAWAIVLGRLAGQDDLLIGVPVAQRNRREIEGLIGCFVNTLAMRIRLASAGKQTLSELLEQVRDMSLSAYSHQDVPFEQVLEVVQPPRSLAYSPIFQTLFALQNTPQPAISLADLTMTPFDIPPLAVQFDLALMLHEDATTGTYAGDLLYATALFEPDTVQRWLACYPQVLAEMLQPEYDLTQPHARLSLLDAAARHHLLETLNATATAYDLTQPLAFPLNRQAQLTPDAIAVEWGEQTLSYRQLHSRANQLAHHLKQQGIGIDFSPDQVVALYFERSVDMLIAILATLKAGAAWLPLDPHHPRERTQHILNEAQARIILTQHPLAAQLPNTAIPSLSLDTPETHQYLASLSSEPPTTHPQPTHLAYIIYTSGSTGQPKGAMNEHRAVVNRLLWMQDSYRLTADDRILQKTPYSFDVSVWELLWPLISGARLILAQPKGHQDPAYLQRTIDDAQITTVHFVPSMLQAYLDHLEQTPNTLHHPQLKRIIVSGEELSLSLHDRCLNTLPHVELHNLYGPTEAAIDVTYHPCQLTDTSHPRTRIPIGKPIANTRIYILDPHGQPVPVGVTGELHIGGIAVGRGYLNRPELTAERFIPDPYSTEAHARLYKTGDLARWNKQGEIEYLGRNDQQIKLRGLRIELGEIEAQLRQHPQIKEACVIAQEGQRLIAYYVPNVPNVPTENSLSPWVGEGGGEGENSPALAARLQAHLQTRLPEYMIPAIYVPLAAMPLSVNGKLDRKALPQPQLEHRPPTDYEPPQGEIETRLAEIWQEILQVERVGRQDDFFALGGHSLTAMQILLRIKQSFEIELELAQLFQTTTLAGLAEVVYARHLARFDATEVATLMAELEDLSEEELRQLLAAEDE